MNLTRLYPVYMAAMMFVLGPSVHVLGDALDEYLAGFNYQEREEMKIETLELVTLLADGKVQFIDIRFPEEYAAWHMGFGKNIPLNELPTRLHEFDKTKVIVTACPHKDRAAMARMFLTVKGFNSRYLKEGLLGLAEFLRGDKAKGLMEAMSRPPEVVTSKKP